MLVLLLSNAIKSTLRELFGQKTDPIQWESVKAKMEQSFGPIHTIDAAPLSGKTAVAFFENQTLLGDHGLNRRNSRYIFSHAPLSMPEAIGKGFSREEAIVDLWDRLTTLGGAEHILQLSYKASIHGHSSGFSSHSFDSKTNCFYDEGEVLSGGQPIRPSIIRSFLALLPPKVVEEQPPQAEARTQRTADPRYMTHEIA